MTAKSVLPFSDACERNKEPILARLRPLLADAAHVLEIGSGTGQHAVHFAAALPTLRWTCSDLPERHEGLKAQLSNAALRNLDGPLELDVTAAWPALAVDAVFTANTAHIMPWRAVETMFAAVADLLEAGGRFMLYGPFHYAGVPTSEGNAAFDDYLRERDSGSGIRDAEAVQALAAEHGLRWLLDAAMPANNRLFAWEKTA